jgi:hypothetical protein
VTNAIKVLLQMQSGFLQLESPLPQKLNVILFFDIEFFKYFFRVLHEASSSWLKLCWFILGHKSSFFVKSCQNEVIYTVICGRN